MNDLEQDLTKEIKVDKNEESQTKLLFDLLIQNNALKRLLISKGIISLEELQSFSNKETALLLKPFLQKVGLAEEELENVLNTLLSDK